MSSMSMDVVVKLSHELLVIKYQRKYLLFLQKKEMLDKECEVVDKLLQEDNSTLEEIADLEQNVVDADRNFSYGFKIFETCERSLRKVAKTKMSLIVAECKL